MWANQQLAFSTLSTGLQDTLIGLRSVHSAGMAYGTGGYLDLTKDKTSMAIEPSKDAYAQQLHPTVTAHPNTGRPALYVNSVYTTGFEGWAGGESHALLGYLHRHAVNENFTCRLRWRPHTLAIWDNRCTQHNALNDYRGVRREMYRTSVKGAPRSLHPLTPARSSELFRKPHARARAAGASSVCGGGAGVRGSSSASPPACRSTAGDRWPRGSGCGADWGSPDGRDRC